MAFVSDNEAEWRLYILLRALALRPVNSFFESSPGTSQFKRASEFMLTVFCKSDWSHHHIPTWTSLGSSQEVERLDKKQGYLRSRYDGSQYIKYQHNSRRSLSHRSAAVQPRLSRHVAARNRPGALIRPAMTFTTSQVLYWCLYHVISS